MHARAANVYRKVYLESASPTRLLDELFARLLRDCQEARAAIAARDLAGKGRALSHALTVVGELTTALDASAAPDLVSRLSELYHFVWYRLWEASVQVDAQPIEEAERIVEVLRDAFQQAAVQAT